MTHRAITSLNKMFSIAGTLAGHVSVSNRQYVTIDMTQATAVELVPIPPSEIHIDNPNATSCSIMMNPCKVGVDTTCLSCKEFGWVCINLSDTLQVIDGHGSSVEFPANATPADGWCLPPIDTRNQINRFTTKTILTFSQANQVWNYRTLCRYPTIFTSLDDRSDCNVYHNPCSDSKMVKSDGSEPESPINFDPFIDGRCLDTDLRVGVWDIARGPQTIPRTIGNSQLINVTCPAGYINSLDASVDIGIRKDVVDDMALVGPVCIPAPCKVDSASGKVSDANFWDNTFKCCVCDAANGWTTAKEDFSGSGNYLDSPSGVNACRFVGIPTMYEEHGYVYPDGSSLFALGDGTTWYEYNYRQGTVKRPMATELSPCAGSSVNLKPPTNAYNCVVSDDLQKNLIANTNCLDADNNVIFNPILANGRVAQANQTGPTIGGVIDWPTIENPRYGSIRSNIVRVDQVGKPIRGVASSWTEQVVATICATRQWSVRDCHTAKDKISREWKVEIDPVSAIPDITKAKFPGPTADDLTTNRIIAKGGSVKN